jgi:hypothetical protein
MRDYKNLRITKMISTKTDFANRINTGEVKVMALCEYKVLMDGEFKSAILREAESRRRTVISADETHITLANMNNDVSFLSWDGDWEFSGHRLTITTNEVVAVYVVNPLF